MVALTTIECRLLANASLHGDAPSILRKIAQVVKTGHGSSPDCCWGKVAHHLKDHLADMQDDDLILLFTGDGDTVAHAVLTTASGEILVDGYTGKLHGDPPEYVAQHAPMRRRTTPKGAVLPVKVITYPLLASISVANFNRMFQL